MTRNLWVPLTAVLISCNKVGFDAVSISPTYSYVEGCNTVKVSGTGFGDDLAVSISMPDAGGTDITAELEGIVPAVDDPSVTSDRLRALNEGFYVLGTMPAAPVADKGWADVTVSSGGASVTLPDAYYYVACPADGYVEGYGPSSGITAGADIALSGCNLNPDTMRVQLLDEAGAPAGAPAALVSDCRTASVHFAAPAVADGTYYVTIVDAKGTLLWGEPCGIQDSATYYCSDFPVTYGGAK